MPEGESYLSTHQAISFHSIRQHAENNRGRGVPPSLNMVIGTDKDSAGFTVTAYLPSGGDHRHVRNLVTVRWRDHPQSTEELVRIAIAGLRALQAEQGWPEG